MSTVRTRLPVRLRVAGMLLAAVAAVLAALAIASATGAMHRDSPKQQMALGTVTVTTNRPEGDVSRLTVRYDVRGRLRSTTGSVDTAAYEAQGRVVWVCFDPEKPGTTRLRLPLDPLCSR